MISSKSRPRKAVPSLDSATRLHPPSRGRAHAREAAGNQRPWPADKVEPSDVLDLLLAQILEGVVEPVAHLVPHDPTDADPARLGKGLQTRRDVHTVAEDVVLLSEHVSKVDAHPELDPPLRRDGGVPLGHPPLHLHSAPDGVDPPIPQQRRLAFACAAGLGGVSAAAQKSLVESGGETRENDKSR
jgi:hypothetical protein